MITIKEKNGEIRDYSSRFHMPESINCSGSEADGRNHHRREENNADGRNRDGLPAEAKA
jgi:hypothetical protein